MRSNSHLSRAHDGGEEEGGAPFGALSNLCEGCLEGGLQSGVGRVT